MSSKLQVQVQQGQKSLSQILLQKVSIFEGAEVDCLFVCLFVFIIFFLLGSKLMSFNNFVIGRLWYTVIWYLLFVPWINQIIEDRHWDTHSFLINIFAWHFNLQIYAVWGFKLWNLPWVIFFGRQGDLLNVNRHIKWHIDLP